MGYLWLNVSGRYLWWRLLARALHMAARRPTVLILVEAQSRAGMNTPLYWTTHTTLSFLLMARRGLVLTCMSARGPPPEQLYSRAMRTLMPS